MVRLFAEAWSAARYQRGTRAYLSQHDNVWRLIVCGLRQAGGCQSATVDLAAHWAELDGVDRRMLAQNARGE